MSDIFVAMSVDSRWLPYIKTTIKSVEANTKSNVTFYIFTRDISEELFYKYVSSNCHQIPMDTISLIGKTHGHVSVSTMDRLMIPSLVQVDKLVYLDVDIVVCADILDLFNSPTGDCGIAAKASLDNRTVIEYAATVHKDTNRLTQFIGDYPCFNAGVMVLDLTKMRSNAAEEEMLTLNREIKCNDQVAYASYSKGRFVRLEPEWNVFVSGRQHRLRDSLSIPVEDYKIVHWVGSNKPWRGGTTLRDMWLRYE